MIKVSSRNDILKLLKKDLGGGEESTVGLLEDGKHVAKAFHQPRDLREENSLLIGKNLKQSSFYFNVDLYRNNNFILGSIANYSNGNSLDSNIINLPYINLLYATTLLKRDIKIISDAHILSDDVKNFNMKYTDDFIAVVDTGRFIYSNKDVNEIYRYNLEMIFSVIRFELLKNRCLKELIDNEKNLYKNFKNNENFPEFFKDLEKYTSEKVGESIESFDEYVKLLKK